MPVVALERGDVVVAVAFALAASHDGDPSVIASWNEKQESQNEKFVWLGRPGLDWWHSILSRGLFNNGSIGSSLPIPFVESLKKEVSAKNEEQDALNRWKIGKEASQKGKGTLS